MKELAYGASHEINNPLANISAQAQALLREEKHPERRRALEAIYQQAMRAHEMISDLMLFARPPALQLLTFDLCEMIEEVAKEMDDEFRRRNIRLATNAPTTVELVGDRQQLGVALTAVVSNALEAVGQDGAIDILVRPEENSGVCIDITDTGPGVSEEVRRHMFDPFYSGREAGRGLGFGLSKCWRIVTDHGGDVAIVNCEERGAMVTLRLPVFGPAV
ncbi:MAG: HAMP domain-containing histidine kinase [Planctomycetes bacterium]|nr:HAMP domain-containing histidine kinase [Planctomycetota bacterium]